MKVAIVGTGGGAVGVTTYQRTLIDGLRTFSSHEVWLVSPHEDVAYTMTSSRPMRALTNFVGIPDARLRRAVAGSNADVFIVNAAWPVPHGIKNTIAIVHEAVVDEIAPWGMHRSSHKRLWVKYLYRAVQRAAGIVANSEFTRDRLHEALGIAKERIGVAPPALLAFDGSPTLGASFPPFVTVIGWFHPRKDLPLALHAWRRAIERGLDRDLVLAGQEGPDDRRYGSVARRILEIVGPDLARRVHRTGIVSRPDLGRILAQTDALLIASSYEGFGIPAIEAFAFGKPVVATDRGSLPEVVGGCGTVTPPEPEALAAALVSATTEVPDPLPRVSYARSFTIERQVTPVIELLEAIEHGAGRS